MRGIGKHVAPWVMLPTPADITSAHVMAQVQRWATVGAVPVHTEIAREIAAWWAQGDNAFAVFSSAGLITDDLGEMIAECLDNEPTDDSALALEALQHYVRECMVTPWSVGSNVPGYLPEGDVRAYLSRDDALSDFHTMIDEAPDDLTAGMEIDGTDCAGTHPCTTADVPDDFPVRPLAVGVTLPGMATCGACGRSWDDTIPTAWTPSPSARCPFEYFHDNETCDYHALSAEVGAYKRDSMTGGSELVYLHPDFLPLPIAYWMAEGEPMKYGEYLDSLALSYC